MPRKARRLGFSGYYHVIMRGINRQIIFEDEMDYRVFLSLLQRCRKEESITICAYCLMSNHVHLLLNSPAESLSVFVKKLGVHYVAYFNNKYDRVGHLFQDRFRSEPIEDEAYLLTVFRYILRNPEKAGLCKASEYAWSSYSLYGRENLLTDTSVFHDCLGDYSHYKAFMEEDTSETSVMKYNPHRPYDDTRAAREAIQRLQLDNLSDLQKISKEKRDQAIKILRSEGFSERQISRITGFSRGLIRKILQ